jgi:hypothetical protein
VDGGANPPLIRGAVPYPNPQHRGSTLVLAVDLEGPADGLECRAFTRSLTAIDAWSVAGTVPAGWSRVRWHVPADLSVGTYFIQVRSLARNGRGVADTKVIKLVVLP